MNKVYNINTSYGFTFFSRFGEIKLLNLVINSLKNHYIEEGH